MRQTVGSMAHECAGLAALLQLGKQSRNVDQRFVIRSLPVYPPDELRNVLVVVAGEQRFSQRRRGEREMHADMRRSGRCEVILRPVQIDVMNLHADRNNGVSVKSMSVRVDLGGG